MRPADKLQDLVDAYVNANERAPRAIAITPKDFHELTVSVNSTLRKELHYFPKFFHGIPIVISPVLEATECR